MASSDIIQCSLCRIAFTKEFARYTTKFNFLVGEPIICERCFAEKLGIVADWQKEVYERTAPAPSVIPTPKATEKFTVPISPTDAA